MTSKPHMERPDIERMGQYAGGPLHEDDSYLAGDLIAALAWIKHLEEQLEAERRGKALLIVKNDRLGAALDAANRLLDDVHAKGEKHAADLLRVRTQVSAALKDSNPASKPFTFQRVEHLEGQGPDLTSNQDMSRS